MVKIDAMKTLASSIQTSAAKIDSGCTAVTTSIHRLLDEALTAVAGAHSSATAHEAAEPVGAAGAA